MKQIKLKKITAPRVGGGHPKRQHYVPQTYLSRFSIDGTDKIWVYDIANGSIIESNIKEVASRKKFYDTEISGEAYSIESSLSEIEDDISALISNIITKRSLSWMDINEKVKFSKYVILQMQRTEAHRKIILDVLMSIDNFLAKNDIDTTKIPGYISPDKRRVKHKSIEWIEDCSIPPDHIINKEWCLFETSKNVPFYTSDNPIAIQNTFATHSGKKYGTHGLASPFVEIYFPISPTLCVAFYSKDYVKLLNNALSTLGANSSEKDAPLKGNIIKHIEDLTSGSARPASGANVTNINSVIALYSDRQIFCHINDFSLANEMRNSGDLKYFDPSIENEKRTKT